MRVPRALRWSAGSPGFNTLRTGVLALLAAAAVVLCGLTLDNSIYQPIRELPGRWVDGHFQTEPFWIASRTNGYVVDLEVPDTRVPTVDHTVDGLDRHFTQRCGQPFAGGVTWSLWHFGRVIARNTNDFGPWCEDASAEHTLRAEMAAFRASPGAGYSIRIEGPGWALTKDAPKLPLRLSLRTASAGLLKVWFTCISRSRPAPGQVSGAAAFCWEPAPTSA